MASSLINIFMDESNKILCSFYNTYLLLVISEELANTSLPLMHFNECSKHVCMLISCCIDHAGGGGITASCVY